MPLNSVQAKKIASGRLRDANGHFVKIKATSSLKTPLDLSDPESNRGIGDHERSRMADFEKPLVSVNINNPFKKILYWLDQIRRRQTTTLAFKLSIPLIALPIVVAGVFTLGRFSGISFQKSQAPTPTPVISPKPDPITSRAGTLKIAVSTQTKYLLALKNGELVVLNIPSTIDLNKYNGKQVLVTGTYNSTANILKVTDIAEVQLFNTTIVAPLESSSSSAVKQ